MSNVCAAIGLGQMQVLDERIRQRRAVYQWYEKNLDHQYFEFTGEPDGLFSNRWLTTVVVKNNPQFDRESLRQALLQQNIESRPLWKPMHLQPVFKDVPAYTNGLSERLFADGLCLPSGSNLQVADLNRILEAIKRLH